MNPPIPPTGPAASNPRDLPPGGWARLLVTHTDRDGVFSGAALLRALGESRDTEVLLTQGSYLAPELEDLVAAGRRYQAIFITDTYWHAPAGDRVRAALRALLAPGAELAWIDHHPSSVEHQAGLGAGLPLSALGRIVGDREGRYEAVSLVLEAFGTAGEPVAAELQKAAWNGWGRNGEPVPPAVQAWLDVVDGLARCPELPAVQAADLVRRLARGFQTAIPAHLAPLGELTRRVRARTAELGRQDTWPRLPSTDGGWGLVLDLHREPLVNSYELAVDLANQAGGRIDYFVTQEHPGVVHYVSGPGARAERDAQERGGMPHLRLSTFYKVGRRKGIDLAYCTRRAPAADLLGPWIDAHPYIVKAPWRRPGQVDGAAVLAAAGAIGATLRGVLERCRWNDRDRLNRRFRAWA